MLLWAVWFAVASEPSEPSEQTLIYYNARMALRENQPLEAVKLWFLRNAVEDQTGRVSPHDADFHSVTWAALGQLGVCPDGHPKDEAGAGLWPLALHNWVVRNMGRRHPGKRTRAYDAFQVGRQQRLIAIGDVLGAEELANVQLFRGRCSRAWRAMVESGELPTAELGDRQVAVRLLRYLLERARSTLAFDRVRGWAAVEARVFDLDLQQTNLAARAARRDTRTLTQDARELGLSGTSVQAMADEAPITTLAASTGASSVLRACDGWPVSEWMALSHDRRLFLFHHARLQGGDVERLDAIALGVIDALIATGEGDQVTLWIAQRTELTGNTSALWNGERGQRLLALDGVSGFRERAVVALHRGVEQLERGALPDAMRSFAFALQHAPESSASESVDALARRWLTWVAARFEIGDELLVTLRELVSRRVYSGLLEDLLWRAAFRADQASFERGLDHQPGRGALMRRADLLAPLSRGDVRGFLGQVRDGLEASPSETLRFLEQLVERLEAEDAEVREGLSAVLEGLMQLVAPLEGDGRGRQGRTAGVLLDRVQGMLEGLGRLGESSEEVARALSPNRDVFVGSVRLAPSDPLPWPFRVHDPPAPSVFEPLQLTPIEWPDEQGQLVFGWSLGG